MSARRARDRSRQARALLVTHVAPEPPWSGERRRVAAAYDYLSHRFDCDIAVCARSDAVPSRLRRKLRRPLAPPYSARYECPHLEFGAYDIIWVFELWALSCVPVRVWRRVLWDKDTVMSDGYRRASRGTRRLIGHWIWRYERAAAHRVRHAFVSFEGDVQRFAADGVTVLPNGFTRSPRAHARDLGPAGPRLGFTGLLSHAPNRDALIAFARDVLPALREEAELSSAELWVAGSDLQPEDEAQLRATPGVVLLGYVPDLGGFYEAVDLALAPMQRGAGTPTKVIEALGNGVPVVGTGQALRGVAEPLRERCVEVGGEDWSRAIRAALELEPAKPSLLAEVDAAYDWSAVFERAVTPVLERL
jgi:glycosyltransferase involved in cell wall biosynthesis